MQDNFHKAHLCACNNCNAIMIDENPDKQPELSYENIDVLDMKWVQDKEDITGYWACPNCLTDDNLVDISDEEHLLTFLPVVHEVPKALKEFPLTNLDEVRDFVKYIIYDLHLVFHPDTPFEHYSDEAGKNTFTKAESDLYNGMIYKCFMVCDRHLLDFYELVSEVEKTEDSLLALLTAKSVLKRTLMALNAIPNQKIFGADSKEDTYGLAADVNKILNQFDRLRILQPAE